ncbi:MAG: CDP-diacylglycerol--serine O-phosphatidyltransferase [Gemmatimonadota bacterium]
MTAPRVRSRPTMRRAVVLFPSGLTLTNLFFGVFAIITASRGDFRQAGIYVLIGGIFDVFDGRVARAANAGTQFGEELDSLVDAISFGLAPAMIMYFSVLNKDNWDWVVVFAFVACAVMRLARFNIEQAGTAKTYFQGLPSPAAGCTLASYYWFSQSWLYSYGAIGNLPWQEMLRFLMVGLAGLMISNIPYPTLPRTGVRNIRALGASILIFGSIALLATKRLEYFFPLTLAYVAWGLIRSLFSRLFERRQPTIPYDLSEGEDDEEEDEHDFASIGLAVPRPAVRDARPPREDRQRPQRPRGDLGERPPRTEERPPRPDRPDRGERPQRTEAERAARREKREKRDKRAARPDRPPRPAQSDTAPAPPVVGSVPVAAVPVHAAETGDTEELIGVLPGEAGTATGAPPVDGAPPARKRKRRRRRGERKERGPGVPGATDAADPQQDGGEDDGRDDGRDDGPDDSDSHSPYSAPVAPTPPPTPPPAPITETLE